MPGAYFGLAVIFAAAPRLVRRLPLTAFVATTLITLGIGGAGILFGLRLYPATDVVVAGFGLAAGVWIGRAPPPRARPMGILLAVLAALDTVQVFAAGAGDSSPSPFYLWTMFLLVTSIGRTAIGFADLAIFAAVGEHWRRRGAHVVWSILPAVAATVLADAFSFLVFRGGIPLLPFVLAGWLITEVAAAAWRRSRPPG